MRKLLGIVLVGLALWLGAALLSEAPLPAAQAGTFTSSTQCQECHPEVYGEWSESQHAQSWINEDVRAQAGELPSGDFANKDCVACHSPRPIFGTGLGKRVLPRSSRRSEGVDCLACHQIPEDQGGGMAGTLSNKSAACNPQPRLELQRVEYCGVCHNQHKTVDQFVGGPADERGEDCLSCHMPFRQGDPNLGRDHRMLGGHSLALVQSAVALRAERTAPDQVRVEVENVFGGHSFPTDERSRAADVFWRPAPTGADGPLLDAKGGAGWRHLDRMRSPYRNETDIPDTLLLRDETRVLNIKDPDATGPIQVALYYKLAPYFRDPETGEALPTETVDTPDMDAKLVHQVNVE